MPEVFTSVRHLRNFTIIRDASLSVRYEGRRRWQSAFHKGRFTSSALLTDHGPIVPVLVRDGACNWAAMPHGEGSES
jgi:hypothetical protein